MQTTTQGTAQDARLSTPAPRLREIADLKGPPGLPLLGNTLQFKRESAHRIVEAWARQYGPIFRFRLVGRTLVGVAGHELVTGVLRSGADVFGRTRRVRAAIEESGSPPGVFGSNGAEWERQRRMVMSGFDPAHIRAYLPSMLEVTQRLQQRWEGALARGEDIALKSDLMRYTVDTVTGLAFGVNLNTLQTDGGTLQRHLDKVLPGMFRRIMAPFPYWHYYKTEADRELQRSVAAVHEAIRGFIAAARERLNAQPERRAHPVNVLEAMLVAADRPGSGVSDREVMGNVLNLLLGGEDTTAFTLAWLIWLLHSHPQTLRAAQEEVRAKVAGVGALDMEVLASLDYLDACTNEAMRLKPVAPMLLREAFSDTVVGDLHVPKGSVLWLVVRHDSLQPEHFEDPQAFRPERWLSAGALSPGSAKRIALPFGAGPRMCPGRYLALLEIKLVMAMLLSSFEIADVRGSDAPVRERLAFTMAPTEITMRLAPRR